MLLLHSFMDCILIFQWDLECQWSLRRWKNYFRILRKSVNFEGTFCREGRPGIPLYLSADKQGQCCKKNLTKSLSAPGISSAVYSWKRVHLHQKRSLYDCTYIALQCCWIINGAITTFVIKWNCDRLRIFAIHSLGAFKAWGTSQKDQRPSSQRGLSTSVKTIYNY